MSNDEQLAEKITSLVRTMMRLQSNDEQLKSSQFKRISGENSQSFDCFCYIYFQNLWFFEN